jgi:hypothetical protein
MTRDIFLFTQDTSNHYVPVVLRVRSVSRDGAGRGVVGITLSNGSKMALEAEFDPGKIITGATFYATVEAGNRLVPIPWKQAHVEPAFTVLAQEGAEDLRAQVSRRVSKLRELLRSLRAAPVPSSQLLASAKDTLQTLFSPALPAVGVVTLKRVNFAQAGEKRRKNRAWRVDLRPPGEVTGHPMSIDAFRDTGAEINCISDRIARQLQLKEVGLVDITGITSTPLRTSRVRLHVTLPRFGVADEVEAAVLPDLVDRCGREFLVGDELSERAEAAMGVA